MSEDTENPEKLIIDLKINELRGELEKRGIDKSGVKAALIEKLEKAIINEGFDPTNFVFYTNTLNKISQSTTASPTHNLVNKYLSDTKNFFNKTQEPKTEISNNNTESEITPKIVKEHENFEMPSENEEKTTLNINKEKHLLDAFETDNLFQNQNKVNEKNDAQIAHINKKPLYGEPKKTESHNVENLMSKKASVSVKSKLLFKTDEQNLAASVWIRGISNTTKAADLKTLFSKHGKVITAKIFTTKNKLSPTCFGYITMSDFTEVDICIQKLNRTNLKGKVITVEKASRSLLPQINKAGKTALSASTLLKSVELDATQNNKKKNLSENNCVDNKIKIKNENLKQSSPEICHENVKLLKNITDSTKNSVSNSTSAEPTDKTKKVSNFLLTNCSRIISTTKSKNSELATASNTASVVKSRKIEPPINIQKNFSTNTSSRMKKSTATSSSNRNARNISRRVIANSKARIYRLNNATNSYVFSSRNKDLLRFKKTASGIRAEKNVSNRIVSRITSRYSRNHRNNISLANASRRLNNSRLRLHDSHNDNSARNYCQRHSSSHHENKKTNSHKMSSRERDEILRLMRKREDEYRKKEEELKLQRERERMRFERERLEREKLEIQQLKLTAQLANAQLAFLPQVNANTTQQSLSNALAGVNLPELSGATGDISHGRNSKIIAKHSSNFGRGDNGSSSSRRDRCNNDERRSKSKSRLRTISRSRSPHRVTSSTTKFERNSCHNPCHNRTNYKKFLSSRHRESLSSTHRRSSSSAHRGSSSSAHHDSMSSAQSRSLLKTNTNTNYNKYCYERYNGNDNGLYVNNNEIKKYNESNNFDDCRGQTSSRNRSPARRGENHKRDSQSYLVNNVYHQPTSSRTINENLNSTSSFSARTDPLYASRVGNNTNVSTINSNELFGYGNNYYTNSGGRSDLNYMSTRITGSSNTFRNSLPSTYQNTLNVSGTNSSNHWNSSRTNYVDSVNGWTGIANNSTSINEGWTGNVGRSDWNNSYTISHSMNNSISGGRYGNSNGVPFSSRRY